MFDSFKLCTNVRLLPVSVCIYLFHSSVCCQLLKAWGAHVTVTCSQNAEGLVRGLGADEVVDYTAGDAAEQLEMMEKYVLLPRKATRLSNDTVHYAKLVTLYCVYLKTDQSRIFFTSLRVGL